MVSIKLKLYAIIMLLCFCLVFAACSSGDVPQQSDNAAIGETVGEQLEGKASADSVFSISYDSGGSINPINTKSAVNLQFASLLYDFIYTVDENFEVSSSVITSAQTEDYSWWVFTVDTSIEFSDGTNLTAADVAYSIAQARLSSLYSGRLSNIYGVSALSSDTFAITATPANSQLPSLLTIPIIKSGSISEAAPLGTGPYKLSDNAGSLVLSENSRMEAGMPIDVIYLRTYSDNQEKISAFEDGLIDIVTNDPTGLFNLGYGNSNDKRYYNTTSMQYVGYNMRSNIFSSAECRYAMNYVIDRNEITENYMSRAAVASPLPALPGTALYDAAYASKFGFDLDKAFELFEKGNIGDHDNDGVLECIVNGIVVEIDIKFIVNNENAAKLSAARQIAEHLNSLGLKTTLYELSYEDYIHALESGDYDMYYGELKLTPDWNISALFAEDSALNYAQCTDDGYAEAYYTYLAAPEELRAQAFKDACSYVLETGGITPVCFERREVLSRRGVITGIKATQYNIFNKIENWEISFD